jgi:hypothetical protein
MTQLREDGRIILARGEATGHCHEVLTEAGTVPDLADAEWFELDGHRELIVLTPCILAHHEHGPIALAPDGSVAGPDLTGRLVSRAYPAQVRQGDVLLVPTSPGTWRHVQQHEQYEPEVWRAVTD